MADKSSVFSKGGGGTNFEQYIQTAFLVTMIVKGNVPGIPDSKIDEIALQATRLGYKTDDLFVKCSSPKGEHRLIAQIKHEFSFTEKDTTFKEVIEQLWSDFNNPALFDKNNDRLLIIKENLNKAEANNIKSLTNWAKSKSSSKDFFLEVKRIIKKQETLNIFKTVIESIKGSSISGEDLWSFMKCLEVLAYDFGNHDSTHKAYYLNLLSLSKRPESSMSESDLWSQLYEYISVLNKDGGLISKSSIAKEPFHNHFNLNIILPLYSTIAKLHKDSNSILNPLSNEIHGFHIERVSLKERISELIKNQRLTIITGNPGVGKSAIIKDVLAESFGSANIMVFRADQLNEPHLANVFSNLGINDTIEDIISCLSLVPEKIIFIDSLEKLLEGDSENAFKQLYNVLNTYPDIKIVAASRAYAIELLRFKYGLDMEPQSIMIDTLSDEELQLVEQKFPQIKPILNNERIRKLLVSPKYIDFALTMLLKDTSDYSSVSLMDFKKKLWNHIVENISERIGGMPRKRSIAFSKIAIDRAKKMRLFIEPVDVNEDAVEKLENDNIIFKDGVNYAFSPSHDILEDWALTQHINRVFEEYSEPKEFFKQIGHEPAMRRAFRLWVEDALIDETDKVIQLVEKSLSDDDIENFWADETLIAIFKSSNSKTIVTQLESRLNANDYAFLKRCIHLIRTTCKESKDNNSSLLYPIGSGWRAFIEIISKNISKLDSLRELIVNFIEDWKYKTWHENDLPPESDYVVSILTHFFKQIENQDKFWITYSNDEKYIGLINILFNLLPNANDCTLELIDNAINFKKDDDNWKLSSFYNKVKKKCLSGIYSNKLVQVFPDKVCELAWLEWKYVAPKNPPPFYSVSDLDTNNHFGLKEHIDDFPGGIYKTPFYNMLRFNTYKAFDFIIEFCNYCSDNYAKSEFSKVDNVVKVQIKLKDGIKVEQIGSYVLWQAYRRTGKVTPYVFSSILVSLEKYLLELAKFKNQTSKKLIQDHFYYLMGRSNNVAITSVLTSLCLAYPDEVADCILSILGVREFYEWDSNRALHESLALAPMDTDYYFAQEETYKHNNLEHRKKYYRGLCDFVLHLQFNVRSFNKEIFEILDEFTEISDDSDIYWKKTLSEIDGRNWEASEYNEKLGGVTVQPKYQGEVKELVDTNRPRIEEQNTAANYANWVYKKYINEKDLSSDFKNWQEAYSYLEQKKEYDGMFDKPATLAHVGLRDYIEKLTTKQIDWCVTTLINSISIIHVASWDHFSFKPSQMNFMDREPSLKSFSLIFKYHTLSKKDAKELNLLLFYCIISPIAKHEKEILLNDFRTNLWVSNPEISQNIWNLLVNYAPYKKENRYFFDDHDKKRLKMAREKEFKYISDGINSPQSIKIDSISFETHLGYILFWAVYILPLNSVNLEHREYIKHIINIFFDAIFGIDKFYESSQKHNVQHEDKIEIMKYLSKYFVIQNPDNSSDVLNSMLNKYYSFSNKPRESHDIYELINQTLQFVISELDFIVAGRNNYKDLSKEKAIDNFWKLWDVLYNLINGSSTTYFSNLLLLDIQSYSITWDENFKDWGPLEGKELYYKKMIEEKGSVNINSILNVFVAIGHTKLLPQGLNWMVSVLKKNPDKIMNVNNSKGEQLIKNLYHHYCYKIKDDRVLLANYIWLLDNMIDLGSSIAYLIRENVITYKSV